MKKKLMLLALSIFCFPIAEGAIMEKSSDFLQNQSSQTPAAKPSEVASPDLTLSAAEAKSWLSLIDTSKYEESWEKGAKQFENVITKQEWKDVMNAVRKPLGSVVHRELIDQRPALNPKGLVPGDYMVIFYKTQFQNKPSAYELMTLQKENDKNWRVLTYQVQ